MTRRDSFHGDGYFLITWIIQDYQNTYLLLLVKNMYGRREVRWEWERQSSKNKPSGVLAFKGSTLFLEPFARGWDVWLTMKGGGWENFSTKIFNLIFVWSRKILTLTTSWVTLGHVSLKQAPGYPQRNRQHSYIVRCSQIHRKLKSKNPQFASWNGARSHR